MKKYIILLSIVTFWIASCEKKVDPVDTFTVAVEFKNSSPKALTNSVERNPKDSISFDFTINSGVDMAYVEIQKNGVRIDTFRTTGSNQRTFSGFKAYRADSIPGLYSYRIVGRDAQSRFLGDGGKIIDVTVKPDFDFWSYRILQTPDTTNKTNKCYYALTTGNIYSYSEGAANSASIDFGYYYDTTGASTPTNANDDIKHTFYALNSPQPQLNFYDISSWTKNATVFKKMPTSVNFVSGLTSGGAINTLIKNNMTTGTSSKVTTLSTTAGSNVIGFKTTSGKYGAILVRYTNQDSPAKETRIEVDVKIQK